MPEMDKSQRPDLSDLADDDVRAIKDPELREAIYRVTQKIKEALEYHSNLIEALYDAVTDIEENLP